MAPGRPGETPAERDDRNLIDLLQELRVATLGVQVLFGFLLGLPFTVRFSHLHDWQRWLYLAVVMLSSISVVLLVGPVAYHRLLFRRRQVGYVLRAANVLAISGMVTVALAVTCAVLLVYRQVSLTSSRPMSETPKSRGPQPHSHREAGSSGRCYRLRLAAM
jgi:hypothetical protein